MEPMHKINKVELRSLQLEDYTQLSQSFNPLAYHFLHNLFLIYGPFLQIK